jgi:glycosyltransferase involved in cell wall biosynthesis
MSVPAISIVLPAYNCSRFIAQTIDSLLAQRCSDFELLIINDGSTDDSETIIRSYTDKRITYLANDNNGGLVYTLNKGMNLAKAEMIARMDADDIALNERLEMQYNWLIENPKTAVVGSTIQYIDEANTLLGLWNDDQQTKSYTAIRNMMPWRNCIAHPSVMIRKQVALKYPYNMYQQHTEDYDLWLRLLADGLVIEKVPQTLLLYREHSNSVTGNILRKSNPFFKQYHCKKRFLAARKKQGRWGQFESKVLLTTLYDGMMGIGKNIKKNFSI